MFQPMVQLMVFTKDKTIVYTSNNAASFAYLYFNIAQKSFDTLTDFHPALFHRLAPHSHTFTDRQASLQTVYAIKLHRIPYRRG